MSGLLAGVVGEFVDRLDEYQRARQEERDCFANCEYSPAYYRMLTAASDDARNKLIEVFIRAVEAAMIARMEGR